MRDKLSNKDLNINFYPEDIRKFISVTSNKYDVVFLDGFTPAKCPCIWSVDFFKELYAVMNDSAILVTYNTSATVRRAMLDAGFSLGNSLNKYDKIVGTIASKNKINIKNNLTEKDFGLLYTKAGIPYRDPNLNLDNKTILLNREKEISESILESSSKYLKRYRNEI
ncbi:MAG: MnmC family methyltransferase [Candidatus Gastranaerophilales bacterium]|nr:MnmC family methyltransferase [Candidatus Gastranaerophilales bacterium]